MASGGDKLEVVCGTSFERERLAALERLEILDSAPEPLFDSFTQLAAKMFDTPIALISLVDQDRQWFKARVGLDVDHTARDISFCQHAILLDDVLVVRDAAQDARFCDNPLVTGPPHIRFYAGAPLITPDGYRLGTLCIIDTKARGFTADDASLLRSLAQSVMQAFLLRRDSRELGRTTVVMLQQAKLLALAEDMAGVGTWSWDVATDRTTWSDQIYRIHGYDPGVAPPALEGVLERYHPDDSKILGDHIRRAVAEGTDYALKARIYWEDGTERHVAARGTCRKDANGRVVALVGTFQDITDHVSQERFIRSLTDNLPGMVGYWDTNLRCRFANAAYQDWFGQSPESILDLTLPQLLGPVLFAQNEHHVREALSGHTQSFLRAIRKPSGEIGHAQTHYIPDIDTCGRTQGFYVHASDFTALKKAEEKLLDIAAQREDLIAELTTSNADRGEALVKLAAREAELDRASLRHKQLINGIDDYAIYWLDPGGHVESWNSGAQRLKGYDEREIIGEHYSRFFLARDQAAGEPERILSTALRDGKCSDEGWRLRKDGSAFWSEISVEAVYGDGGALIGFAKVSRDMSARRALEQSREEAHAALQEKSSALLEKNRLLLMAEEMSGIGHWRLDVAGDHLFWSDFVCNIHGRPPGFAPRLEEALDAYHPDDRPAVQSHVDRAIAAGKPFSFEARIIRSDGSVRHVTSRGRTETGPDGSVVGMFGVIQDVTESKRQQQALIESEQTFRKALENAVVGNALVAPDGRWLTVNNALCTLVGYSEKELLEGGSALIRHPEDRWSLQETVAALMSGATSVVATERRMRHRDGHHLWVQVCASLVTTSSGAPDYLVVQFQDLTERKRAEMIKDEFVSTVNHELRTPLTSIFGALRLLGATTTGMLDEKSARLLDIAQNSCQQLTRLVNDILDIEKISAGKLDYRLETLAAGPLIKDIINRHVIIADSYGIRFNVELKLDDLAIRVDPNRFNQALVNLLSNAAKYSPVGSVVEIRAKREGTTAIRISVTDFGPGIPPAFRSQIFGRFAQADNSTTRQAGGSGLGLNITKTLIEAFGGTVSFDSIEGQGATFHFVLPSQDLGQVELESQAHG